MKIFLTKYRNWFTILFINGFFIYFECFKSVEKRACKVDNDQITKTFNHRFDHLFRYRYHKFAKFERSIQQAYFKLKI